MSGLMRMEEIRLIILVWWTLLYFSNIFYPRTLSLPIIPFAMSLVAFFLLILSLWNHEKRMHHTANGSRDTNIRAHIKALQTKIAFLSLYTIFLISLAINIFSIQSKENYIIIFFRLFIGIAFSSCHSFILILGNSKLRKVSLSVMLWLRCWPKDAECSILY